MKTLSLVGIALPTVPDQELGGKPHAKRKVFCSGDLGTELVALDPRHGVFPNLVMTPLLAILYFLKTDEQRSGLVDPFFEQVREILEDRSNRRFNTLTDFKKSDPLTLHPAFKERLRVVDPKKELWLVFGYWSTIAILEYALNGKESSNRKALQATAINFIKASRQDEHPIKSAAIGGASVQAGWLSIICCEEEPKDHIGVSSLERAVKKTAKDDRKESALAILRSIVPLPHNDAYQNVPFGKIQNLFMRRCGGTEEDKAESVFWRFMGKRICKRLCDRLTDQ